MSIFEQIAIHIPFLSFRQQNRSMKEKPKLKEVSIFGSNSSIDEGAG